jgi:hypothetical protein
MLVKNNEKIIEKIKEWLKQDKILSEVKINNDALLEYIEELQRKKRKVKKRLDLRAIQ